MPVRHRERFVPAVPFLWMSPGRCRNQKSIKRQGKTNHVRHGLFEAWLSYGLGLCVSADGTRRKGRLRTAKPKALKEQPLWGNELLVVYSSEWLRDDTRPQRHTEWITKALSRCLKTKWQDSAGRGSSAFSRLFHSAGTQYGAIEDVYGTLCKNGQSYESSDRKRPQTTNTRWTGPDRLRTWRHSWFSTINKAGRQNPIGWPN